MELSEIIKKEAIIWMKDYGLKDIKEINSGYCADFVDFLKITYGNKFNFKWVDISDKEDIELINKEYNLDIDALQFMYKNVFQLHHTFLAYDNKFYDAENPMGVVSPIELTMVKRVLNEIKDLEIKQAFKKETYLKGIVTNYEQFLESAPTLEESKEIIKEQQVSKVKVKKDR